MQLKHIPKVNFCQLPTPLIYLRRLSERFGANIFIKRDDLTGGLFGGNKERMLEYILARAQNSTVVVTVGTENSNHCRLTASCANKLGLKTELVIIKSTQGGASSVNAAWLKQLGAIMHATSKRDVPETIERCLASLLKRGEKPYFIPAGGHTKEGVFAYAAAAIEAHEQFKAHNINPDYIVVPAGTGTTQAGLVLGMRALGRESRIVGISVARDAERCVSEIMGITEEARAELALPYVPQEAVILYDEYIGAGYGIPTKESEEAVETVASCEGIPVDPTYNAKAFAGLFDLLRKKKLGGTVVYWLTGGLLNSNFIKNK